MPATATAGAALDLTPARLPVVDLVWTAVGLVARRGRPRRPTGSDALVDRLSMRAGVQEQRASARASASVAASSTSAGSTTTAIGRRHRARSIRRRRRSVSPVCSPVAISTLGELAASDVHDDRADRPRRGPSTPLGMPGSAAICVGGSDLVGPGRAGPRRARSSSSVHRRPLASAATQRCGRPRSTATRSATMGRTATSSRASAGRRRAARCPVATYSRSPSRCSRRRGRAPACLDRGARDRHAESLVARDLVVAESRRCPMAISVLGEVRVGELVDRVGLAVAPVLEELGRRARVVDLVEVHVVGLVEPVPAQQQRARRRRAATSSRSGGRGDHRARPPAPRMRSAPERPHA